MTESNETPDSEAVDWSQLEGLGRPEGIPDGYEQEILSPEMITKRLIWDIAPCQDAVDVARLLGLPPASDEIEEREHEESHIRLIALAPIGPFVALMAQHATRAVVASVINGQDHEVSDEERVDNTERLEPVILQTSLAVIAELVDVGVLHLPHGALTNITTEDGKSGVQYEYFREDVEDGDGE